MKFKIKCFCGAEIRGEIGVYNKTTVDDVLAAIDTAPSVDMAAQMLASAHNVPTCRKCSRQYIIAEEGNF